MANQDYTTGFSVAVSPIEAFNAINDISGWWTENVVGESKKTGDEFEVRFGDIHYSKQRLTEIIPGQKVIWLITDSKLTFVKKQNEWTGTTVNFDISEKDGKTQIDFTHHGLTPQFECYGGCSGGWEYYIGSLQKFMETGKGEPAQKDE